MTSERNGTQSAKWVAIYITLGTIIAGTCIAWGSVQSRLCTAEKELDKTRMTVADHEKIVIGLQGDLRYIRESVDLIRADMKARP